ncbi:MAG TPA: hypothetical protein VGN16_15785, partial [Acidobacteriaceae bacterium]
FFLRLLSPFILSTIAATVAVQTYVNAVHVKTILDLSVVLLAAYATTFPILACFSSGRATFSDILQLFKSARKREI